MFPMKKLAKFCLTLCLGLIFYWLPVGNLTHNSVAIAANTPEITAAEVSAKEDNLITEITTFLHAIPKGYYTVMQVAGLKNLMNRDDSLLIDVREPGEYAAGHIPLAINIPLRTLTENLTQIPQNRPVVLYCSSGYRTAMGVMALQMLGYDNVRGFPPSIQGWQAAGEALEN